MIPLYNGQENHYKKMLDLQEKLRKSEEERIRLEERFKILVQQSRNRHQVCVNNLRIRYVEFLEEQKARDERNNKLLGALNKVDNSLALMTAKTETLNILRKQYEAHLLRTYGNQRPNGSVTADSGLGSNNDQELSSNTVYLRPVQSVSKSCFSPSSKDFSEFNHKIRLTPENQTARKQNLSQNSLQSRCDLTSRFSPSDDPSDFSKYRLFLPSYPDNSWKHSSIPKSVNQENERLPINLTNFPKVNLSTKHDLDSYIEKIRRLHAESLQNNECESEQTHEELDHEQNTSGDLLNVTLSDDGFVTPAEEEEAKKEKRRLYDARQTYATQKVARQNIPKFAERLSKSRNLPEFERRSDLLSGEGASVPTIDKFSHPEIVAHSSQKDIKTFGKQQPAENALKGKLMNFDEAERLIQQSRSLLASDDVDFTTKRESPNAEVDKSDQEVIYDADNCIVDDYDHSVDIDSWMPDDLEQQVQEVRLVDDVRDRPRRQLESIEEVEHTEDEDAVDETNEDGQVRLNETHDSNQLLNPSPSTEQKVSDQLENLNSQSLLQEELQQQVDESKETYENNEGSTDDQHQQYYEQNNNGQLPYQENAEYFENYNQQQNEEQQQYEYPNDSNQQYEYDGNAQYVDYENQQYVEGQYDYNDPQYQQYNPNQTYEQDPNQAYEQDPNQEYQQYGEYEGYKDNKEYSSELNKNVDVNEHQASETYDYSMNQQPHADETAVELAQSNEGYKADESVLECDKKETLTNNYEEQIHHAEPLKSQNLSFAEESDTGAQQPKNAPMDNKAKKDVIKSILDSDSESFIERNLSNTESDFDFN